MRISDGGLLLLPLALVACGPADEKPVGTRLIATMEAEQRAGAEEDGHVLCARGNGGLTRACTVEQASGPDGLILTLRQPDGGFDRLLATRDGRGVVAADGAEPARVRVIAPDAIEVALGEDRYQLPATVKQ